MRAKDQEQQAAKRLRLKGFSVNEISSKLNVSKSSVSIWVRDIPVSRMVRRELLSRGGKMTAKKWVAYWKKYPKLIKGPRWPKRDAENFFDTWTSEMAYVLGFFAADGCMFRNKRGSCYIAFYSTDYDLIDEIKNLIGVKNLIEKRVKRSEKHKDSYVLQVGSKGMYSSLEKMGLAPNKSLVLSLPKVPDEYLNHFLRGYFDGDGHVYFGLRKRSNRPSPSFVFLVGFTSGSRFILSSLQERLDSLLGLGKGSLSQRDVNHYVLSYSAKASRQLFTFMYPTSTVPHLHRKKKIFDRALAELG